MDIARVSNKYQFRSLETWALDAAHDFVTRKDSPVFSAAPYVAPTSAGAASMSSNGLQVARLVRLAQTCSHERLLDTMATLLTERMRSSIQWAFLGMSLADELDLRALRGAAYAEVLQKMASAPLQHGGADAHSLLVASPAQQLRLLAGYYRLSREWESLRKHPVRFVHAPTCGALLRNGCMQSWIEFWKEKTKSDAVLALGMADVVGRLKVMVKELERWGGAAYMHHDCRHTARKEIVEKIREFAETLPDYFVEGYVLEL